MTGRERHIELPHIELGALEWGTEGTSPVMALHGWLDNAASFQRLAPHLDGLHLLALDLPGHGRSGRAPDGRALYFVDWVPMILQVAEVLRWQRFSLIGHSMGAGIASLIPAVSPESIERVVLLEGMGPLSTPAELAPEQLAKAMQSERRLLGARPRVVPHFDAAVDARMKGSELDRESTRLLVERSTENVTEGVRFTHDPRLKSRSRLRLTEDQVLAFLSGITCPVLAVGASDGLRYPEGILERRLAAVPNLETAEVEGGHHVHLTHPERVAPIIREFFGI
jgi:pimeloyl-ACP methyl ester carboxylesterase